MKQFKDWFIDKLNNNESFAAWFCIGITVFTYIISILGIMLGTYIGNNYK